MEWTLHFAGQKWKKMEKTGKLNLSKFEISLKRYFQYSKVSIEAECRLCYKKFQERIHRALLPNITRRISYAKYHMHIINHIFRKISLFEPFWWRNKYILGFYAHYITIRNKNATPTKELYDWKLINTVGSRLYFALFEFVFPSTILKQSKCNK